MDLMFTTLSIKRFLFLVFIASTVFIFYFYFPYEEYYWLIWTALLLSIIPLKGRYFYRLSVIALTGITLALVVLISNYISHFPILLISFISILTLVLAFLKERYKASLFPILIINMLAIVAAFLTFFSAPSTYSPIFIMIGTAMVCLLQFIFFAKLIQTECCFDTIRTLHFFRSLTKEFFLGVLQASYMENMYLFERRIYVQKNNFIRAKEQLQNCMQYMKTKKNTDEGLSRFIQQLTLLYTIFVNCSQIRWRIKDHASFDICKHELKLVAEEIDKALFFIIKLFRIKLFKWPRFLSRKKLTSNLNGLERALSQFEENYQHVLQVATDDPLAFFLFLHALKTLVTGIHQLNQLATEVAFS